MLFKKTQFEYILISIALFFIGVVFVIGSIKFFAERQVSPELNEPIIDPTNIAEWPVYVNEKYHYSTKYPPGWNLGGLLNDYSSAGFEPSSYGARAVYILVLKNPKQLSLAEWLKEAGHQDVEERCEEIIVNNVKGLKCSETPGRYSPKCCLYDFSFIEEHDKSIIYWIYWGYLDFMATPEENQIFFDELKELIPADQEPETLAEAEQKVFDAIVSTFRILAD